MMKLRFPLMLMLVLYTALLSHGNRSLSAYEETPTAPLEKSLKEGYARYERAGWNCLKRGDYEGAVHNYKTAIDLIENSPGENWKDVSEDDMKKINHKHRISKQVALRYALAESYEKKGEYQEAIAQIEWLMKNQTVKGKEKILRNKLSGMKESLLNKISERG
jgi:tetratricopeptide (TPR) repeat protein